MGHLAELETLLLHENHNLGLAYAEGYVFLKILQEELVEVLYDPSIENAVTDSFINIAATTFAAKKQLNSSNFSENNMFSVKDDFHTYQAFFGVQPAASRVFISMANIDEREIDVGEWGRNSIYRLGYINGRTSPFSQPSAKSELFIPPAIDLYMAIFNPLPYTISPTFYFVINRMLIKVHKDPNDIEGMLKGKIPFRPAPIGGLNAPKFNMATKWLVKPVQLDATREEIERAVGVRK